jgi:hypothetical protein
MFHEPWLLAIPWRARQGEAARRVDLQKGELGELSDAVAQRALQVDAGQPPAETKGDF